MDFVQSFLIDTALVPVIASTIIAAILSRFQKSAVFSGATALSVAFFAAWASQDWAKLTPTRYLDWMPYCGLTLGLVAYVRAALIPKWAQWLLIVAATTGATWLLVPDFPRLQPPRVQAFAMISIASAILSMLLESLACRVKGRVFLTALMVSGTVGALVLQQSFGMKFAQILGMLTASLAGPFLYVRKQPEETLWGLPTVFSTLTCNLMFIGVSSSTSDVPRFCYAVVPLVPIGLWLLALKSVEVSKTNRLKMVGIGLVALTAATAVIPALMAHPPWEEEVFE